VLTYKGELVGIQVKITEESYTSQASFLDADPLPIYGRCLSRQCSVAGA
jgi:putative transposase